MGKDPYRHLGQDAGQHIEGKRKQRARSTKTLSYGYPAPQNFRDIRKTFGSLKSSRVMNVARQSKGWGY